MIGGYFDFENVPDDDDDDDDDDENSIPEMQVEEEEEQMSDATSDSGGSDDDDDDNDIDLLAPPYGSPERQSSLLPATFNLIATIIGGGVLSLPWAFGKCGIILATVLMIVSAFVTNRSLHLLTKSSRQSGASSYGEVGRMAFGKNMEIFISALLFIFLLFVMVAYMVLLRDIWTPLIEMMVGRGSSSSSSITPYNFRLTGNQVLLILLILLSPFLIQRTLHSLRFNCYVGFASVSVLCIALCHHGFEKQLDGDEDEDDEIKIGFENIHPSDVLLALPVILLIFLCHFNVLPIQANLIEPSRERMATVLDTSVFCTFIVMYLFGLGGYLYAGSNVQGNILLNVVEATVANNNNNNNDNNEEEDWMFLAGRIGFGITILLALPMMALPCRDSWLELVETFFPPSSQQGQSNGALVVVIGERTSLLRDEPILQDEIFQNPYWYYGSTIVIVALCYIGAATAPGVAIVWTICGTFMSFLISFILPSACYLQIGDDYFTTPTTTTPTTTTVNGDGGGGGGQQRDGTTLEQRLWRWFCIILLGVSIAAAIGCTWQTIMKLI